jgi:hypothetical protein
MLELPRRPDEIAVPLDSDHPDVVWHLRPLSDAQYQLINLTAADYTAPDGQAMVRWDLIGPAAQILPANHLSLVGLLVDGELFTGLNPDHYARLLPQWKVRAMIALWREARGLDLDLSPVGNSPRLVASPPAEETPATD